MAVSTVSWLCVALACTLAGGNRGNRHGRPEGGHRTEHISGHNGGQCAYAPRRVQRDLRATPGPKNNVDLPSRPPQTKNSVVAETNIVPKKRSFGFLEKRK